MGIPVITFEECTIENLSKLKEFAITFDPPHEVNFDKHRIVIVKADGLWVGYAEIVTTPVVFSAWCSHVCTPKIIQEGMKAFTGWAKLTYGEGLTAVPLNTKSFSEVIMDKLGFYRLRTELYKTK